MVYKKLAQLLTIVGVMTACIIPFVFSSGCMFDPGTGSTVSDSATYKVNGKVYTSDAQFLAGIHVSLFDSVNSIRSTISITDTNGSFAISFPYVKRSFLFIDLIVPSSLSALYSSKRATIRFDDNYFKYSFTKDYEAIMDSK